ncbi:hypothetical protein LXJ59_25635, partial [Escherichia coli]|nr:hypothetical protein [Escherichia coli]
CGCTVLSTDICALPELNSPDIGYVCSIREEMEALTDAPGDAQKLRPLLKTQLHTQLARIATQRGTLCEKALRARQRVAQQHDPDHH